MSGKSRYHHGDLRNALLSAALAVLDEQGFDALSLRAVAARAGVSHAAPAHHFPTLRHLLTALAAVAFTRFGDSIRAALARAEPNPRSQLAAAGDSYVGFARDHPHQFRLIFSQTRLDWTDPELQAAGLAAYQPLRDVCAPVAALRGDASDAGRRKIELMVWSSVHGYAHLMLGGQLGAPGDAAAGIELPARPDVEGLLLG